MAETEIEIPQALKMIGAAMRKKLDEFSDECLALRKRENAFNQHGTCPTCGEPDVVGMCTCLPMSKAELEKVAPPGREDQVKELKGKVANPYAVAWASYDKSHKKAEKVWDPERKEYTHVEGERSIGTSAPPHKVTPRAIGRDAERIKDMWGVCKHPGCVKQAGHTSEHTPTKKAEKEPTDGAELASVKPFKAGPVTEDKGSMKKGDAGDAASSDFGLAEKNLRKEYDQGPGNKPMACSDAKLGKSTNPVIAARMAANKAKAKGAAAPAPAPAPPKELGKADLFDPHNQNDSSKAVRQERSPGSVLPGDKDPKVVKAPGSGGVIKKVKAAAMKKAAMSPTPKAPKMGSSGAGSPSVGGMPKSEADPKDPEYMGKALSTRDHMADFAKRPAAAASAGKLMDNMLAGGPKPLAPGQPLSIKPIASNPIAPKAGAIPGASKGRVQSMVERAASKMAPMAKPGAPAPSAQAAFGNKAAAAAPPTIKSELGKTLPGELAQHPLTDGGAGAPPPPPAPAPSAGPRGIDFPVGKAELPASPAPIDLGNCPLCGQREHPGACR